MPNKIQYAAVFNKILDEKFYVGLRTKLLENTLPNLVWNNGKEIKVPKIAVDGLGDVVNCNVSTGDVNFEYETKTLQFYRGRKFNFGRYDVDETNFALSAGNLINVFLKDKVYPEVDKLRLSTIADAAVKAGNVSFEILDKTNVYEAVINGLADIQDEIGYDTRLTVYIGTKMKKILGLSTELTRMIDTRDMTIKGTNIRVDYIDDEAILEGVPSSYLKTGFKTLSGSGAEAEGGVVPAFYALDVNFLIVANGAADAIARPTVTKVFTPDENQNCDGWTIWFDIYHGCWVYDNKINGIYASIGSPALPVVYAESEAGGAANETVVTVNTDLAGETLAIAPEGYSYYIKLADAETELPLVGTTIDAGYVPFVNGGTIAAGENKNARVVLASTESGYITATSADVVLVKG